MLATFQRLLASLPFVPWKFTTGQTDELPIVDLGYLRQQATTYNVRKLLLVSLTTADPEKETLQIYSFSNIRYGRPPVGELRWAPPQAPEPESTLQQGETDRLCFQAQPHWQVSTLGPWIEAWVSNDTAGFYKQFPNPPQLPPIPANLSELFPALLPGESEDCLFLDLHVRKDVFDRRQVSNNSGVAVFVWVHGGGLTLGSKTADTDFQGLIKRSTDNAGEPVVVVSINYRLGAFGFLGGPSLRKAGGVSNAGLLDQDFAFKWVQKYVHLFGGDPNRITVAGESAGGASIYHHITARGGKGEPPVFHRAILQSAGWNPVGNSSHLEKTYHAFLKTLKVTSIEEARAMHSIDLRNANFLMTFVLRWGELGFGVEPDDDYVPAPPGKLLLEGEFHHNISVMMGQNAAEGVIFTPPWARDNASTFRLIADALPTASDAGKSYILTHLYPSIFTGSNNLTYRSYIERAQLIVAEAGVLCNSDFLGRALSSNASSGTAKSQVKMFNYLFSIAPAFHGDDLSYTFYSDDDPGVDADIATKFQRYLLNFVRNGDPNGHGLPRFEEFSSNSNKKKGVGNDIEGWTLNVTSDGFVGTGNPGSESGRCRWWQKGLQDE